MPGVTSAPPAGQHRPAERVGDEDAGVRFRRLGSNRGSAFPQALAVEGFSRVPSGDIRGNREGFAPVKETAKRRNLMQIKYGMEKDFADFSLKQSQTADGRTVIKFIETWSGMMECAVEHGADNVTEAAGLTVRAAADAAGVSKDEIVVTGAAKMLDCWAYGDGLKEWFMYRPPEILTGNPDIAQDLWYASQGLCDAIPKIVDAYPCILDTAPDLLEVRQIVMDGQRENTFPIMSM